MTYSNVRQSFIIQYVVVGSFCTPYFVFGSVINSLFGSLLPYCLGKKQGRNEFVIRLQPSEAMYMKLTVMRSLPSNVFTAESNNNIF